MDKERIKKLWNLLNDEKFSDAMDDLLELAELSRKYDIDLTPKDVEMLARLEYARHILKLYRKNIDLIKIIEELEKNSEKNIN